MWPMALLGTIWPHTVTLLWIQDVCIVGAETVAFTWIIDFVRRARPLSGNSNLGTLLVFTGLALIVANPWLYWAAAWDFHMEIVAILFIMLIARDLYRYPYRKRIWIWVIIVLACGDVSTTYLISIGLSSMLAGSRWRQRGLVIVGIGLGWILFLTSINANRGALLSTDYGYLAGNPALINPSKFGVVQLVDGIARNPTRAIAMLWSRRLDIYAVLSSGSLIGLFSVWTVIPVLLILIENGLNVRVLFIVPGYQDALLFVLLPVGSIAVLSSLSRRNPMLIACVSAFLALNTLGWGAIWIPRTASQWLDVSPNAAKVLLNVARKIPAADEVVTSQGISGPLSGRKWFYTLGTGTRLLARTSPTWVVVTPSQGIEGDSTATSDGLISELAGSLRAKLITHSAGVWAFRWIPQDSARYLIEPAVTTRIDGWTTVGSAGKAVLQGAPSRWYAGSNGSSGYVVAGDYWRVLAGRYNARIDLVTSVSLNVEIWNATAGILLTHRQIKPSRRDVTLELPIDARHSFPPLLFRGTDIFKISPTPPPPGNQLEIRIWTPGGGRVEVRSLSLVLTNS